MTRKVNPLELLPQHAALISSSSISPEVSKARGYRSVTTRAELRRLGFGEAQCRVPSLLIPIRGVAGEVVTYQIRPDQPRSKGGKIVKYETPVGARMVVDVPPAVRTWLGDPSRPLFITEGVRKADAAVSRGLCSIALLGVWNFRGANEHAGKVALPDWESIALNERVVYVAFDSDVMVKAEVYDALVRLKGFLEHRGARVLLIYLPPSEGGAKRGLDDYLASGRSVEELLALASTHLKARPRHQEEDSSGSPYRVEAGHICREKPTQHGVITEPLCNFTATVLEEIVLDDGAEATLAFQIEGCLDTGVALPAVRIPASRFSGMNWVTESWGLRAVIRAGQATKDYLREAIQRLSADAKRREVFTHTGWRVINGAWVYLTTSGAVGREGVEVDLGPELARYRLPKEVEDPTRAMRASLALLRIAPFSVTAPLFAGVYRAPLASALPLDLSLWVEGVTGSLKSTLTALFLSHFGDFDRTHLPGAWSSTANQLERRAFLLKDSVFVIDDYAPSGLDARELETKAARLIRSQGNIAGRGRLRSDLSERPTFPPRGLLISTGEQHPPGQSLLARMLVIELAREEVQLAALIEGQRLAARLPHALAGYIAWLVPQMEKLPTLLRETFDGARARATADGEHLRVPETLAHLWIGLHSAFTYAEEIGACSPAEAEELRGQCWDALLALGRAQGRIVEDQRPTRRFLEVLLALVTQGRGILLSKDDLGSGRKNGGPELLGWQDDECLYLIPEAAYQAVSRFCREAGEPFPVREVRLRSDLAREKLSDPDPGRQTAKVRVGVQRRRVLRLKRGAVEDFLGEEFPCPAPVGPTGPGRYE